MCYCRAVSILSNVNITSVNKEYRGVYVPEDERWPEHFRGIGIRIEDSVCVGEDSPQVLTTEAVKEVSVSDTVTICRAIANVCIDR